MLGNALFNDLVDTARDAALLVRISIVHIFMHLKQTSPVPEALQLPVRFILLQVLDIGTKTRLNTTTSH
jgi:hypothetical protein